VNGFCPLRLVVFAFGNDRVLLVVPVQWSAQADPFYVHAGAAVILSHVLRHAVSTELRTSMDYYWIVVYCAFTIYIYTYYIYIYILYIYIHINIIIYIYIHITYSMYIYIYIILPSYPLLFCYAHVVFLKHVPGLDEGRAAGRFWV
jgi:hypothetical protein